MGLTNIYCGGGDREEVEDGVVKPSVELERLAECALPLWLPFCSFAVKIVIAVALLPFFFDLFFFDYEVVVRANVPEGCRETLCVANVA